MNARGELRVGPPGGPCRGRGPDGWRVARDMRPAARTYSEAEALNPCGWGWRWRRRDDGLWHALTRSHQLRVPTDTHLHADRFEELAERCGMHDAQLLGWLRAGMPGSSRMLPRALPESTLLVSM